MLCIVVHVVYVTSFACVIIHHRQGDAVQSMPYALRDVNVPGLKGLKLVYNSSCCVLHESSRYVGEATAWGKYL